MTTEAAVGAGAAVGAFWALTVQAAESVKLKSKQALLLDDKPFIAALRPKAGSVAAIVCPDTRMPFSPRCLKSNGRK